MRANLLIAAFPEAALNFVVCDPESDEQFERILAFEPEIQKALDYIQKKGYELEDVTIYGPQAYITKVSNDFEKEDAPFAKYFDGKVTCVCPGKE